MQGSIIGLPRDEGFLKVSPLHAIIGGGELDLNWVMSELGFD